MKTVVLEAVEAMRVKEELHAPYDIQLETEKKLRSIPDIIVWLTQLEDERRFANVDRTKLPEVLKYPQQRIPWRPAPLKAFINGILP